MPRNLDARERGFPRICPMAQLPRSRDGRLIQRVKKKRPRGDRPGAGGYLDSGYYYFSSCIAALALSVASEAFPALHAASASLTRPEAFLKSAERGACSSWARGA